MQYTLVGFFTELDWRPLLFVKPLPPNRICGACGLVRPKTMLLPCAHSLCQPCYDQCAQEGFHTCPFDSHKCQDEDVITIVFSADELLRREVKCWNEGRGCERKCICGGLRHTLPVLKGYWTDTGSKPRAVEMVKLQLCMLLTFLVWQQLLACDKILPVGPRLFRAKAHFGKGMRLCNQYLVEAAKEIPSDKVRKGAKAFCHILNACKESIPEKTTKLTGILYSEVGLTYSFADRALKVLKCLGDNNLTSDPFQVSVDGFSLAQAAALAFGWN
ncbi:hypothetical protein V5799_027779 [Amblyomma americanum]|uniref:RING-type domain-containing protein n=1 Tax=Amblyomma americanum TaxID=6943 RepID=A0AAQ4DER3_AMBAM